MQYKQIEKHETYIYVNPELDSHLRSYIISPPNALAARRGLLIR